MHKSVSPRAFLAAAAASLLFVVGCAAGVDESEETVPAFATTTLPEDELIGVSSIGEWRCGEVKEALYRTVAIMSVFASNLDAPPVAPSANDAWTADDLREAMRASGQGFTTSDQQALNAACELFGQHDAALELWAQTERGDACDVWRPAHASAEIVAIDIGVLHPLSSHMWVSATGAVAEGHGRCIAERAN